MAALRLSSSAVAGLLRRTAAMQRLAQPLAAGATTRALTWGARLRGAGRDHDDDTPARLPFPTAQQQLRLLLQPQRHASTQAGAGGDAAGDKPGEQQVDERQLTMSERFKLVWSRYGWVAVGTYAAVYVTTLSSLAALISMGVDIKAVAETVGIGNLINLEDLNPSAGTFVLAFIATKFTSPIRIPIVIVLTPRIARFFEGVRTPTHKP